MVCCLLGRRIFYVLGERKNPGPNCWRRSWVARSSARARSCCGPCSIAQNLGGGCPAATSPAPAGTTSATDSTTHSCKRGPCAGRSRSSSRSVVAIARSASRGVARVDGARPAATASPAGTSTCSCSAVHAASCPKLGTAPATAAAPSPVDALSSPATTVAAGASAAPTPKMRQQQLSPATVARGGGCCPCCPGCAGCRRPRSTPRMAPRHRDRTGHGTTRERLAGAAPPGKRAGGGVGVVWQVGRREASARAAAGAGSGGGPSRKSSSSVASANHAGCAASPLAQHTAAAALAAIRATIPRTSRRKVGAKPAR